MKTKLEIKNERILELESQVKKLSLNLPVSGSCFLRHRWSKWKQFDMQMINFRHNKEFMEIHQRRECLRCGKVEIECIR
jgi:hypothetical protein